MSAASSQGFAWLYRYFRGKVDGPHGRSIYRDRPRSRREAFGLARAYYRKRVIG